MMNSKEAINLLTRCWEHRFNLEDYECDELVELIQQQDKIINLACKTLEQKIPGYTAHYWRKYLQSEVGK